MSGQGVRNAITAGSKIFKKVATGSAKATTGSVRIGVATEAEGWRRHLETAPEEIGGRLKKYVEAWDHGPMRGTAEMVARYGICHMRIITQPLSPELQLLNAKTFLLMGSAQGGRASKYRSPETHDSGMLRRGRKQN